MARADRASTIDDYHRSYEWRFGAVVAADNSASCDDSWDRDWRVPSLAMDVPPNAASVLIAIADDIFDVEPAATQRPTPASLSQKPSVNQAAMPSRPRVNVDAVLGHVVE
jgi:hypothetical protein